ncbi:hypothetical protein [Pedobacter sp. Leaf176]|uniref:hypothetical protein n=1 Tax=Pedobacter sp. Leaf176 TaxID=1736286 RepID=UPI0006F4ABF3|nr:hypothetical protein [Pedobacter sp. Leaf176]KQR67299.1 hypothetical protein ASF92_16470 [Pedobacter sp. Leaf176]
MKKIVFALLSALSLASVADAQKKTSGAIQYETTIDPAAMMAASGVKIPEQMAARMPSSSKSNFELLFNATNASYMPVEDAEDSNGAGGGGGGMGRMMRGFGGAGGNREYYYSFADKKLVEVFDLNDTTYVMQSGLKLNTSGPISTFGGMGRNQTDTTRARVAPPKIEVVKTSATKQILGLNCNEVILKSTRSIKILDMDREVTEETHIWYTKDLGFDFSPNPNMWTEGAVLAIEGRGNSTIAKSIEFRNVSSKDVTAPKKATPITEAEYKIKMENMMKRFRGNGNGRPGGAGGVVRGIGG